MNLKVKIFTLEFSQINTYQNSCFKIFFWYPKKVFCKKLFQNHVDFTIPSPGASPNLILNSCVVFAACVIKQCGNVSIDFHT